MNQAQIDKANILIGNVKHDYWLEPKITFNTKVTQEDVKVLFDYRENLLKSISGLQMKGSRSDWDVFSKISRLTREFNRVDEFLTKNFYSL